MGRSNDTRALDAVRRAALPLTGDDDHGTLLALIGDAPFDAQQNARLVKNAEAYYRSMYLSDISSWNLRDQHMVETLDALEHHLGRSGTRPKIVVWAHNSHLEPESEWRELEAPETYPSGV